MEIESGKRLTKEEFLECLSNWVLERTTLSRLHELNTRTRESKKIQEEALPLLRYIKHFYREQDIRIEMWHGNQNYDAIIYTADGALIEHVEATCAPQQGDHLLRKELVENGGYSLLTQLTHNPSLADYAKIVSASIKAKLAKQYPAGTTLIVELASEMIIEDEARFNKVISLLDSDITSGAFRRIVLFDEVGTYYHVIP